MDSKWFCPSGIIILFIFSIWSTHVHSQTDVFTVLEPNATLGAQPDSKQSFLDAWKKACATNGGTMVIPKGSYTLSDVEFRGPCQGQIKVIIDGTIVATEVPAPNLDYWISFIYVDHLSISGQGTLDGNGAAYWKRQHTPYLMSLKLDFVKYVDIKDINSLNSKKVHVGLFACQHVTIDNVHLTAPGDSPNTDGIHIAYSDDVRISNVNIATGDDCIAMVEGNTNINITRVTCGPGHGISIGSLGTNPTGNDVKSVTVTNCTLTNTQNGLRIKTYAPSQPGLVSGITYQDIILNNVNNPILIDQHYCPSGSCKDGESSVSIKNVKYINVHGSSSIPVGAKLDCSKKNPCQDIELSGLKITNNGKPTTGICSSADAKFLGPPQIPSGCSSS